MALNFSIKLDDQVSPAANKAASSLQQLDKAIAHESTTLRVLENQMRAINRASVVDIDTQRKMTALVENQKAKVAGLTTAMIQLGGAGLQPAAESGVNLSGVLTEIAGRGGMAGRALAALGPYGLAAAAAMVVLSGAVLGVASAVVYLGSKLVQLGVQTSEAKGDVTRSLELLYGSQKAAEHTYKVLEAITGDIAISQERVMELADTLIQAGQVNGDAMVKSIAAIGKAEAARKGAGAVLEGVITRATSSRMFSISRAELMKVGITYKELSREIAKGIGSTAADAELRLRTGGVAVKAGLDALSKVVDAKMGDLAMRKFATVGNQAQRLRDLFGRLFEGVDSGPFGRMLMVIANTLEESSVSGSALRTVLKSAFDELSAAAERVAPYLDTFFRGAILLALKLYNALYPVRQAIARLFGGSDTGGLEKTQDKIVNFATNVGNGFKLAAIAMAWMIDNAGKLAGVFEFMAKTIPMVGPAIDAAKAAITLSTANLGAGSDKTQKSGVAVADGVAAGIKAGTPAVEAAMSAMGEKGIAAFDKKMQIHSPSRVMALRGRYLDEGLAKGVNDNADAPASAMAAAGSGAASAIKPGDGGRGSGAPVLHINFMPGSVNASNGGSLSGMRDQLTDICGDVFQRFAATQGGG